MPLTGSVHAVAFALAAIVVIALTLRRPLYGVAALILTGPFDFAQALGPTTLSLPKIVLLGFIVGLALRRAPLWPLASPHLRILVLSVAALLAATALAATQADYRAPALREILKALEYAGIFGATLVAFVLDPDEQFVRRALALTVSAVALAALLQVVTGAPSALYLGQHAIPRIAGPLEGPNQLAGFMEIAIAVLLAFMLRRPSPLTLAALALAIVAELMTFSRGGIFGSLAGVVSVIALRRKGLTFRSLAGVGVVALIAALTLAKLGVLSRFMSFDGPNRPTGLGTRSELWHAALTLWRAHPWLGVGPGNFELELPRAGVTDAQTHANSLYLQSLAEGGVTLFSAVVATLAAAIWTVASALRSSPLALGALAATVATASHQIFDLMFFYPKVGGFWWIVLALGAGATLIARGNGAYGRHGATAEA